jgi:membrane-associated phospholipid phosphatase
LEGDFPHALSRLRDDARGTVNGNNVLLLGTALAGSIAIRQDLDDEVRQDTARHSNRWGKGSEIIGMFGEVQYQVPVLLGVYAMSLRHDDEPLHDFSTTLISAYTITGLSTLAVKGIANTDRPTDDWNGGQWGFPSFHAGSSFAIAAVLDEFYGVGAGLPAYTAAGLISWSRIDERDHDLSDVFFGAALGYVIGKSVAGRRLFNDPRVRLFPYVHPTEGATGLALERSF